MAKIKVDVKNSQLICKTIAQELRCVVDLISATDLQRFLSDQSNVSEEIIRNFAKTLADTPNVTDQINLQLGFIRAFTDSINASESISVGAGKQLTDSSSVTDSEVFGIGKSLSDSLAVTESILLESSISNSLTEDGSFLGSSLKSDSEPEDFLNSGED